MKMKQARFNNLVVLFDTKSIGESILILLFTGPLSGDAYSFYRIPNQLLVAKRKFPASLEC